MRSWAQLGVRALVLSWVFGFAPAQAVNMVHVLADTPPRLLSAYGLFVDGSTQQPAEGVVPYDLNTPLFSDYADKLRFVYIPAGQVATYHDRDVFSFPVGTVLVKTFAYPDGPRWNLIETRLLIHKARGWIALPYIWNADQSEAVLKKAGGRVEVTVPLADGPVQISYKVPNVNQCKGCHIRNDVMEPIGPKARNLNRTFEGRDDLPNQLTHWQAIGYLAGVPDWPPSAPDWDDPSTGTLDARARAYLDVNCAHCHQPGSPGDTSGLYLEYWRHDATATGIWKRPVAAGRGSGGLDFAIDPGHPDRSIMIFRMESQDPGIMMPEAGRSLVHTEGVALLREWITNLAKSQASSK